MQHSFATGTGCTAHYVFLRGRFVLVASLKLQLAGWFILFHGALFTYNYTDGNSVSSTVHKSFQMRNSVLTRHTFYVIIKDFFQKWTLDFVKASNGTQ